MRRSLTLTYSFSAFVLRVPDICVTTKAMPGVPEVALP